MMTHADFTVITKYTHVLILKMSEALQHKLTIGMRRPINVPLMRDYGGVPSLKVQTEWPRTTDVLQVMLRETPTRTASVPQMVSSEI